VISEIADHFILDKTDVLKNQKNNPDLIAWWVLQHKRNYKPFLTKVNVTKNLKEKSGPDYSAHRWNAFL
jgi:hypothetical protein